MLESARGVIALWQLLTARGAISRSTASLVALFGLAIHCREARKPGVLAWVSVRDGNFACITEAEEARGLRGLRKELGRTERSGEVPDGCETVEAILARSGPLAGRPFVVLASRGRKMAPSAGARTGQRRASATGGAS